jgi:hypothetical protein
MPLTQDLPRQAGYRQHLRFFNRNPRHAVQLHLGAAKLIQNGRRDEMLAGYFLIAVLRPAHVATWMRESGLRAVRTPPDRRFVGPAVDPEAALGIQIVAAARTWIGWPPRRRRLRACLFGITCFTSHRRITVRSNLAGRFYVRNAVTR